MQLVITRPLSDEVLTNILLDLFSHSIHVVHVTFDSEQQALHGLLLFAYLKQNGIIGGYKRAQKHFFIDAPGRETNYSR
jgi:hypothetical protein